MALLELALNDVIHVTKQAIAQSRIDDEKLKCYISVIIGFWILLSITWLIIDVEECQYHHWNRREKLIITRPTNQFHIVEWRRKKKELKELI